MKLSDLKVTHLLLVLALLLWGYFFADSQLTKHKMGLGEWQRQVATAIGQLDQRLSTVEKSRNAPAVERDDKAKGNKGGN